MQNKLLHVWMMIIHDHIIFKISSHLKNEQNSES
jgi:hypothetical protein